MSGFLIRKHTHVDKAFLRQMLESAALPTYPDLLDLGKLSLRERLDEIFDLYYSQNSKQIWVAEGPEGTRLGMIWIQASHHPVTEIPDYLIVNIAVEPAARGQGVGKRLLEAAREFCAAEGVHRLRLFVGANNTAALDLYAAMGFEEQTREMVWRF